MYEYFDNGSFEGTYNEDILKDVTFGAVLGNISDSTEQAFAGSQSGKIVLASDFLANAYDPDTFPFTIYNGLQGLRPPGNDKDDQTLYDVKLRVRIPSTNPMFADDNGLIIIGSVNYFSSGTWSLDSLSGGSMQYSGKGDNVLIGYRQSALLDTWVEVSSKMRFVENQATGLLQPINLLALAQPAGDIGFGIVDTTINNSGVMYIDVLSFEPAVVDDCGLTIPNPQVGKTPDLGTGNGSIEVLVEKDGSTLEYKLEGIPESRPYQSSPLFQNLEGGFTYDITVRVDGSCEYLIPGIIVDTSITEPPSLPVYKELPNRHQRNASCDIREYRPVWWPGESYSNFVNSENLISDLASVISGLKIGIINARGILVATNVGTVQLYDDDGLGNGRLAWEIPIFPVLSPGNYRLLIYETIENRLYLVSNEHKVVTNQKFIQEETARFSYRHSNELYRSGFDELPNFRIKVRLQINVVDYIYPFTAENYKQVSTGILRNPRFDVDAVVTVETELYDEKAHRAFAAFLAHNDKLINTKKYIVQGGATYDQDRDKNSPIWNGSIRMVEQEFSTINKQ